MFFISPPFGNYFNLPHTVSIKGSFTLHPRDGLLRHVIYTLRYIPKYKGWVNKIGLRNKGIDWAIANFSTLTNKENYIYSIAIMDSSEIDHLSRKIPTNMNIELNVSCPNVQKDYTCLNHLHLFLHNERKWCIVKLSPYTTFETIDHYYQLGFRQFHCCNTIPVPEGGLSGPAIKPYCKHLIHYIRENYPNCEIIAGGGIHTLQDVEEFRTIGANHFSFSTLWFHPFKLSRFLFQVGIFK